MYVALWSVACGPYVAREQWAVDRGYTGRMESIKNAKYLDYSPFDKYKVH